MPLFDAYVMVDWSGGDRRRSEKADCIWIGHVRAMWHWARDLDKQNLLVNEFAIPPAIESGSPQDQIIRLEEGSILGCTG